MSESRIIACANCGSRYRIPPTFKGTKARCKSCGAVIEVEASLVPPRTPEAPAKKEAPPAGAPAAPPAGATPQVSRRPASHRSKGRRTRAAARSRRARSMEEEGEEASPRSRRAGRRGRAGARGRKRGGEEEEKSNTPLVLGIGGGVVVVAVALLLILGNQGEGPAPGENGKIAGANEPAKAQPGMGGDRESPGKQEVPGEAPPEEGAGKKAGRPEEATAKKEPKKPPKKKPPKKKRVWGESTTPFDPSSVEELAFPEDVEEDEKAEILKDVTLAFEDESAKGMRAANRLLRKWGRKAFPPLVNRLRTVNYMDPTENFGAYQIHLTLQKITLGRNAGYNYKEGQPKQEVAWWNARCGKAWARFWHDQVGGGDPDEWEEFIQARKKKRTEGEEGDEFK